MLWTKAVAVAAMGFASFSSLLVVGCGSRCNGTAYVGRNGEAFPTKSTTASPPVPSRVDSADPFPKFPSSLEVPVRLHPGRGALAGRRRVPFGLPLPRGVLTSTENVAVFQTGKELPAAVQETFHWRSLGTGDVDSVRAVTIWVELAFPNDSPIDLEVAVGSPRTARLDIGAAQVTDTWVPINEGPRPDDYPGVKEPAVYATLPPSWLSAVGLRTITVPLGAPEWSWWDSALLEFSKTAVNDVDPAVKASELIEFRTDPEPWLFDRAMTLMGTYIRSGDIVWLRQAHRAAQFYAARVNADGYFQLKEGDLKYSYGQSMLLDAMLLGDVSLVSKIEAVAKAGASWNPMYEKSSHLWTERHQTYALLAALSAWEATGESAHGDRVKAVVNATFEMAKHPPGGWKPEGCVLHTIRSHEGDDKDDPICSPWMGALLVEAIYRYYLHSEDSAALEFIASFAEFVEAHGLYSAEFEGRSVTVPWYLASSQVEYTDSGPHADIEHTCDVASLVARGAWARARLKGTAGSLAKAARELLKSCELDLAYAHRPNSEANHGKPSWRLAPPRKYNWWFGAPLDLPFLVGSL